MKLPRRADAALYGQAAVIAYFFLGATVQWTLIVGICVVLVVMWGGRD